MSSNSCDIDFVENRYYRINQIFLSMLDLWPYRRSKFANINGFLHFAILLSYVAVQCTPFITYQITMNTVIMSLTYIVPSLAYVTGYHSFYVKSNEVKQMWQYMRDNWKLLKNEAERDIMRQYASSGELHTKLIALSISVCFFLYGLFAFMPTIFDIIFPLNETRPRELHVLTEYFIDEQKYFYAILCHWLIGSYFGIFVMIATFTLQLVYFQHICGLLKIASYRIEHSLDKYTLYNSIQEDHTATQNIYAAVNIHRKALECCNFILVTFTSTFMVLIIILVASLSLNLFRLLQAIILLHAIDELITSIIFVGFHFIFMFVANYHGQLITDHNNEIFEKTYNIRWYMVPVKIQKLLLFIMQNTTKLYILNVGRLIMISMETFTKLTNLSISYFTLIYSFMS